MLLAGKIAPEFELATRDGRRLSLREGLAKGPLLLAFFKVSCPTCQYTFPFLERLFQQLRSGAQAWGIAQDNARDATMFAKEYGITFPILIDDDPYKVSRLYDLQYVPSILLVGMDSRIVAASEGFCKADLLAIQLSLAESLSATLGPLFHPGERIPEYKPG